MSKVPLGKLILSYKGHIWTHSRFCWLIIAQIIPKDEKWGRVNFEGIQKKDILNFIHVFPYIGF